MASWKDKLALTAQRNRQEIVKAKLDRREMMRLGLLTAGGTLIAKAGLSSRAFAQAAPSLTDKDATLSRVPPSPPIRPWVTPMPRLTVKKPVDYHDMTAGLPDPVTGKAKIVPCDGFTPIDGATKSVPHQFFKRQSRRQPATTSSARRSSTNLNTKEAMLNLHPDYAPTKVLGLRRTGSRPAVPGQIRRAGAGPVPQPPAVSQDPAGVWHRRDDHPSAQRPYPIRERRQSGQLLQLDQ